jgi:hypothetical protein
MQFPESWLREFCNPPLNSQALADTLTMAGLEVEEMRPVAPDFSKVVVGQILNANPHPNADRRPGSNCLKYVCTSVTLCGRYIICFCGESQCQKILRKQFL